MYPIVSGIPQSEIAKCLIQEWTIKSVLLKYNHVLRIWEIDVIYYFKVCPWTRDYVRCDLLFHLILF